MGAERNRVTVIFCAIFHSLVSRTLLYRLYQATPSSICGRCSRAVSLVAVSNTIFIQRMENVDQRRWRTVDSVADRAGFVDNEPSRKERLACHETQTFASMSPVFHSSCSFHRCFFRTFCFSRVHQDEEMSHASMRKRSSVLVETFHSAICVIVTKFIYIALMPKQNCCTRTLTDRSLNTAAV